MSDMQTRRRADFNVRFKLFGGPYEVTCLGCKKTFVTNVFPNYCISCGCLRRSTIKNGRQKEPEWLDDGRRPYDGRPEKEER